jgi:DNA polymerase III sliding clamp (beta) subunit (PCNA family)
MDTLNATQLDTVTLSAAVFNDLITGAAIAAHSKPDLSSIYGVQLSASNGVLTAAGTDRYRLIYGDATIEAGKLSASLVSLPDIRRLIAAIKLIKAPKYGPGPIVTLTRAGDILSVSIAGDTFTVSLIGSQFPPYRHLFGLTPAAVETIHLSPVYLAAFGKVPAAKGAGQSFTFNGINKPVTVTIPHDAIKWRGLLMPMKAAS